MRLIRTETERGFDLIRFKDRCGMECSVQQSSTAMEDCIWLGITDSVPKIMYKDAKALGIKSTATRGWIDYPVPEAVMIPTRMHLTKTQVATLLPILQKFVATGEL